MATFHKEYVPPECVGHQSVGEICQLCNVRNTSPVYALHCPEFTHNICSNCLMLDWSHDIETRVPVLCPFCNTDANFRRLDPILDLRVTVDLVDKARSEAKKEHVATNLIGVQNDEGRYIVYQVYDFFLDQIAEALKLGAPDASGTTTYAEYEEIANPFFAAVYGQFRMYASPQPRVAIKPSALRKKLMAALENVVLTYTLRHHQGVPGMHLTDANSRTRAVGYAKEMFEDVKHVAENWEEIIEVVVALLVDRHLKRLAV